MRQGVTERKRETRQNETGSDREKERRDKMRQGVTERKRETRQNETGSDREKERDETK